MRLSPLFAPSRSGPGNASCLREMKGRSPLGLKRRLQRYSDAMKPTALTDDALDTLVSDADCLFARGVLKT